MNIRALYNRFRGSRRDRRGANAVEFALTAPILFSIILGTMDFGWMFCHQLLIDHVAFESARVASIVIASDDLTGQATSSWATHGSDIWANYGMSGTPTFTTTLQDTAGVTMVHVTATVDYSPFVAVFGLPDELSGTSARRLENQAIIPAVAP